LLTSSLPISGVEPTRLTSLDSGTSPFSTVAQGYTAKVLYCLTARMPMLQKTGARKQHRYESDGYYVYSAMHRNGVKNYTFFITTSNISRILTASNDRAIMIIIPTPTIVVEILLLNLR